LPGDPLSPVDTARNHVGSDAISGRRRSDPPPPLADAPRLGQNRKKKTGNICPRHPGPPLASSGHTSTSENQFSLTRAASITSGAAKTKFLSVEPFTLHVVTAADSHPDEVAASAKLDEVKQIAEEKRITFTYSIDPAAHDRPIETDNGWRIGLGRGLDISRAA
jgi:hypothetical protein